MKKLPTDADMKSKLVAFQRKTASAIKNESVFQKETIRRKLDLIRNELIKFKGTDVPYRVLRDLISEHFNLQLSEQTLRSYCINQLGFSHRKSTKKNRLDQSAQESMEVNTPIPFDDNIIDDDLLGIEVPPRDELDEFDEFDEDEFIMGGYPLGFIVADENEQ